MNTSVFAALFALLLCSQRADAEPPAVEISNVGRNDAGWLTHVVQSPLQEGATKIHVLLPAELDRFRKYQVLYLLPVEARDGAQWGDALAEAKKLKLADEHDLICVYATFSHLPWYADHPTDPQMQQETYFLEVVIPLVEREYPALAARDGRLLAGFSKSGWGAWSLLLRHPETFAAAAAWDAPLMEDAPRRYGMGPIFGSEENFQQYRISTLLNRQAKKLGNSPRLVLTGYDNFRQHHQQAHKLLDQLEVPHIYRDGPRRKHHWESGWLAEAVNLLVDSQPKVPGKGG